MDRPEQSAHVSWAQRAEAIIQRHFERAAADAEAELRPLMVEAFNELNKALPVTGCDEVMGMTIIRFAGKFANRKRYPHYADVKNAFTDAQRAVYDDFNLLTQTVGDFRPTFCLYSSLTEADLTK